MDCLQPRDTTPAPTAPRGLGTVASVNGIVIEWDDIPAIYRPTKYNVYRSSAEAGPYALLDDPTASTYNDTAATAGVLSWYRITMVNVDSTEGPYSSISATRLAADVTAPGTPTILSTTQVGENAVTLTWSANTESDLAGYNLWASDTSSGGPWTKLNSSGLIAGLSYTHLAATAGSDWYYELGAVDLAGNESVRAATSISVPAIDATAPSAPTGLSADGRTGGVALSWTANVEPDLDYYNVYRSLTSGSGYSLLDDAATASFTDSTATAGTTYYYQVTAVDATGNESTASAEVSGSVPTTTVDYDLSAFVFGGGMAPCGAWVRGVRYEHQVWYPATNQTRSINLVQTADFRTLGAGDELTARYEFDMAAGTNNSRGKYPTIEGAWNYAHSYTSPGVYKVKLTRTDENGKVETFSSNIAVTNDTRQVVYVSPAGLSTGDGGTTATAVNPTRAQAIINASDSVKLLLQNGAIFRTSGTLFKITKKNIMISTWTSGGNRAIIEQDGGVTSIAVNIDITQTAENTWIEGLDFTNSGGAKSNHSCVRSESYKGTVITGCRVLYAGRFFKTHETAEASGSKTRYVLIQDCASVNHRGLNNYFSFLAGQDIVLLGCYCEDVFEQHVLRGASMSRICIAYGTWKNLYDTTKGDQAGTFNVSDAKTVLNLQAGRWYSIVANTFECTNLFGMAPWTGGSCAVRVGPLEGAEGGYIEEFVSWVKFERNTVRNAQIIIKGGTDNVMIVNNVIDHTDWWCLQIEGKTPGTDSYGRSYTRTSDTIKVFNNTFVHRGTNGGFLRLQSDPTIVSVKNNLAVSSTLQASKGSCDVLMAYTAIRSDWSFDKNIWSGLNIFKILSGTSENVTVWNNRTIVGEDKALSVTIDGAYKPASTADGFALPVRGVWSSRNGVTRLSSDATWTAGAVEN